MGILSLVSIGPGDLDWMIPAARSAVESAEIVIGYGIYLDQLAPVMHDGQQRIDSPLGNEIDRATQAVELAATGKRVALVSSGDIGIYAMGSPVYDVLHSRDWQGKSPEVVLYPGVSAIQATAAKLGAPLGHDFCTISLSNLLTPWPIIERRIRAAAWGDFVIGFYNPRSKRRDWQLDFALDVLRTSRSAETPVVLARNVTRPDEKLTVTTLGEVNSAEVDMFTLVLVGNSQSYHIADGMATPRGYENKQIDIERESRLISQRSAEGAATSDKYPVSLTNLNGAQVTVIGGGTVGTRKIKGLLDVGATVRLISPEVSETLSALATSGTINWQERVYQAGDLLGAKLAFAATDQRDVNAAVAAESKTLGILCNVADAPADGDFHSLATLRQDGLIVAVGTEESEPRRAKQVRNQIAEFLNA
ncbi:MAG: precorrin-3B C(17)-methyltransferase [Candidatus Promineifilaceae bacterium]